jgi:mercuric reductase
MPEQFDVIVIGSGSGGRAAAARAAGEYGARVAIVESTLWGGICPNVACQPTKAYTLAAELTRDVQELGPQLGIQPRKPELAKVKAWWDGIKRTQEAWEELLAASGYTAIKGHAELADERTVKVGDRTLEAERILVATGSRTAVPPVSGIDDVAWLDHVTALDLTELPESLLVVGAGAVGLELAQAFSRFGSRVTVADIAPQIAARADAEAAAALQAALEEDGLEILVGAALERFERSGDRVDVHVDGRTISVTHVLLAAGRTANIEGLGLERVGVEASRHGITVDERMRTNVDGIWAAGDVAIGPQLTPVAGYAGALAVDDMFGAMPEGADYSVLPTAIFTDPELAGVGLTEAEAHEAGHDVGAVVQPLSHLTRAYYTNSMHGVFKVVYDRRTRRVLGVHVVSRSASDIVGALALAWHTDLTVDDLARAHYVYPSFSEGVKEAAEQAGVAVHAP